MEASLAAGHTLVPPSSPRPYGQPDGVSAFTDLIKACHAVTEPLAEVLQNFWGLSVRVVFFGVSPKPQYFWRMDDFHVSQLSLESPSAQGGASGKTDKSAAMATLRLSDSACDVLLERVLGGLANPFSFKQLSPLEGTILNEFSRDVLACLKKGLIKKNSRASDASQLHLMWVIQPEANVVSPVSGAGTRQAVLADIPVGKIVFSVPPSALKHFGGGFHPPGEDTVSDSFFFHVQSPMPVYLGSTRVQLAELEQLEPEDLIVLENSQIDRMALVDPASGEKVPFQATIHHPQRITIPYTQEFATMETQSHSAKQSLWDNLMIEVGASFEPIKLPLKQLKQMTEGLVIEMGDLVHNRIALQVEGKTLAWGELLIVGDKFAVRVNQVAPEPGAEPPMMPPTLTTSAPQMIEQQPGMAPQGIPGPAAEEANLDNFLDKDFDEIADDEEDW